MAVNRFPANGEITENRKGARPGTDPNGMCQNHSIVNQWQEALGGADTVTVNSLAGTSVTQINVDLAASGGVGDLAADTVIVNGTANPDTINVSAFGGVVQVNGLTPQVQIAHPEASNDTLVVNGLAGTDTINVGAGVTSLIKVTVNQ